MFENPYRKNADELQFKLAEEIYDSIRECYTDICDIAENLGFKADNIKNVKDHVFYNEHDLDRYGPDEIEHKRFDATLEQVLEQVLFGLESVNQSLGTNYKLSKIYFSPFDIPTNRIYSGLIAILIRHYHSGNEFKEV